MLLERTQSELLIRLPLSIKLFELQKMLDFIKYKEIVSESNADESEILNLSQEVNSAIWERIKSKRQLN